VTVPSHRDKSPALIYTGRIPSAADGRGPSFWYYEGLPVAYRSRADGIDVLGVGWEETAKYSSSLDPSIQVVQA
jgi:hypothetical protein